MIGFVRKLWRHHKVKAADRRIFRDQGRSPGHARGDAEFMITESQISNRR